MIQMCPPPRYCQNQDYQDFRIYWIETIQQETNPNPDNPQIR